MAPQDVGNFTSVWATQCIAMLPNISGLTSGLVDGDGNAMSTFNHGTWGIDLSTCYKYCGWSEIPLVNIFHFDTFANAFTNYLLPWLALTAQLPYETGSPWSNIMSFCLAVGSPALVTYSLALTILNRYWVRQRYSKLSETAKGTVLRKSYPEYIVRVNAIQYLLSEAQQVPLRTSQENGWLSSLIVDPNNQDWWIRLHHSLRRSRRGVTFSLVAQVLSAIIAWTFVIISAFQASLGDSTVALQISAGSLWVWLIPVICGWIVVGTQYTDGTIRIALQDNQAQYAALPPVGQQRTIDGKQKAIQATSGLVPCMRQTQTVVGGFEIPLRENLNVPSSCGGDICGDERREGPVYNYARVFTWFQFANTITGAVDATLTNIDNSRSVHRQPQQNQQPQGQSDLATWVEGTGSNENLDGDAIELANYCNLSNRPGRPQIAYPTLKAMWNERNGHVFGRMATAALAAIIVQWGTAGSAVIIAYLTPVKGLGCRSGGYMLYGLLGTAAWLLLGLSMILSHLAMIKYQNELIRNPAIDFLHNNPTQGDSYYERTWAHSTLCCAAVLTRYLGKCFAVVNSLWIILSSLFEFMGLYSNCYCMGTVISKGSKAWIMLFKTTSDLRIAASGPWVGGVIMSVFISLCSFIFFYLGSRSEDSSE